MNLLLYEILKSMTKIVDPKVTTEFGVDLF